MEAFHFDFLEDYWDAERKYVDTRYATIPFPFEEIKTPPLKICSTWQVEDLHGYLNTWSSVQKFIARNNYNPVDELMATIKLYWGNNEKKEIVFPVSMRLGKIV